ncbi:MAG: lysozyme inhibitor LprI family protein [Cyanobacteria bacterium J06621_8]
MIRFRYSALAVSTILLFSGFTLTKPASANWLFDALFSKAVDLIIDSATASTSENEIEARLDEITREIREIKASGQESGKVNQAESLVNSLYASNLNRGNPSFDCRKASQTIEFTICDNPSLSDVDGKMGLVYWTLIHSLPSHRSNQLKQEQLDWLKTRDNSCSPSNVNCLLAAYRVRISELSWWAR